MNRVIVTGGTKEDVSAMAVMLMNIVETNKHIFNKAVIFHDGIKEKDQRLINSIIETQFIFYKYPLKIKNDCILNYFSTMIFCKYECFKLLDEYDEVVWSDYDVLIKKPLDEVMDFSEFNVNIVVDHNKKVREMFYEIISNKEIEKYDLSVPAICTPLFSLSSNLIKKRDIYDWCYEKTIEYSEDIFLPEQCIFALAFQEFFVKIQELDPKVYACHPNDSNGNESILHAYGQPKFWDGLYNEHWDFLYKKWIQMGGQPYSRINKFLLRKYSLLKSRLLGVRAKK